MFSCTICFNIILLTRIYNILMFPIKNKDYVTRNRLYEELKEVSKHTRILENRSVDTWEQPKNRTATNNKRGLNNINYNVSNVPNKAVFYSPMPPSETMYSLIPSNKNNTDTNNDDSTIIGKTSQLHDTPSYLVIKNVLFDSSAKSKYISMSGSPLDQRQIIIDQDVKHQFNPYNITREKIKYHDHGIIDIQGGANNHDTHILNNEHIVDDHDQYFAPENHNSFIKAQPSFQPIGSDIPNYEHNRLHDDTYFEDNHKKYGNYEENSNHNGDRRHHEGQVKDHHAGDWDSYHRAKYYHVKVKLHGPGKTPREWAKQEAEEMASMPKGDHYDSAHYNTGAGFFQIHCGGCPLST